jgi:hypothetical protein
MDKDRMKIVQELRDKIQKKYPVREIRVLDLLLAMKQKKDLILMYGYTLVS